MADPSPDESTPPAAGRTRTSVPKARTSTGRRRPSQGDGFLRLIFGVTTLVGLTVLWAVARLIARS